MIIEFTPEELQHIKEIQDSYTPEWERLNALIEEQDPAATKEERADLLMRQQALYDSMVEMLDAYSDQCQRQRFALIKGGAKGIIENARQQAPIILSYIHRDTAKMCEHLDAEALHNLGIGSLKKSTFYVNSKYAVEVAVFTLNFFLPGPFHRLQ